MKNKSLLIGLPIAALAGYAVYRLMDRLVEPVVMDHDLGGGRLQRRVANQLPIAKRLPTISDEQGNYDMDGVSFDSEGVIIASSSLLV